MSDLDAIQLTDADVQQQIGVLVLMHALADKRLALVQAENAALAARVAALEAESVELSEPPNDNGVWLRQEETIGS